MAKPKEVHLIPNAERLIKRLRGLHYRFASAIGDIVDNSIDQDARNISVRLVDVTENLAPLVLISDDGNGMDQEKLQNAMTYASEREKNEADLGKYGLGLKTASISQADILTVVTTPRTKQNSTYDLQLDINRVGHNWTYLEHGSMRLPREILEPVTKEITEMRKRSGRHHGTTVVWSGLVGIQVLPLYRRAPLDEGSQTNLESEVEYFLRSTYHRFIDGQIAGRKPINLFLNGKQLRAWDPMATEHLETVHLAAEKISFMYSQKGISKIGQISVQAHILPNKERLGTAYKDLGQNDWDSLQGLYIYRNNRLIKMGGWHRLRGSDPKLKYLRMSVNLTSEHDEAFDVDITKQSVSLPSDIRHSLKSLSEPFCSQAKRRYLSKERNGQGGIAAKAPNSPSSSILPIANGLGRTQKTSTTQASFDSGFRDPKATMSPISDRAVKRVKKIMDMLEPSMHSGIIRELKALILDIENLSGEKHE